MAQEAPLRSKIPTKSPQPARSAARAAGWAGPGRTARRRIFTGGTGRAATRGGRPVIELECGITVYPAREEQGRWRAVWHENGERQQCEAASEAKLAARLAKVAERLEADAPNMTLRGADLIAFYLLATALGLAGLRAAGRTRTSLILAAFEAGMPVAGSWAGQGRRIPRRLRGLHRSRSDRPGGPAGAAARPERSGPARTKRRNGSP